MLKDSPYFEPIPSYTGSDLKRELNICNDSAVFFWLKKSPWLQKFPKSILFLSFYASHKSFLIWQNINPLMLRCFSAWTCGVFWLLTSIDIRHRYSFTFLYNLQLRHTVQTSNTWYLKCNTETETPNPNDWLETSMPKVTKKSLKQCLNICFVLSKLRDKHC